MWLKNGVNWTGKKNQKWESIALEWCVTVTAYEMRFVLQGINERKVAEEARKLFRAWCAWVHAMRGQSGELLEPMARAAQMVEDNLQGIMAHWIQKQSTAFLEGLNSLSSAVKRKVAGTIFCWAPKNVKILSN
jgi:transposase